MSKFIQSFLIVSKQIYSQSFEKYRSGVEASHFKDVGAELELEPFFFKDAGAELEREP